MKEKFLLVLLLEKLEEVKEQPKLMFEWMFGGEVQWGKGIEDIGKNGMWDL